MTATKVCKVCGKEYKYCSSLVPGAGVFRWNDVACCQEHGNMYFEQVLASRNSHISKAEPEVLIENEVVDEAAEVICAEEPEVDAFVAEIEEPVIPEDKTAATRKKKSK